MSIDVGDAIVFCFETLAFNGLSMSFTTPGSDGTAVFSWEYYNEEGGTPDSVTNLGVQLEFNLNTYLFRSSSTPADGLSVTIRYKPTDVAEVVDVVDSGGVLTATTTFLGQTSPSLSTSDYEVLAEWRPIQNVTDGTSEFSVDGDVVIPLESLFSETTLWAKDASGNFAIRARLIDAGVLVTPLAPVFSLGDNPENYWVVSQVTQGYRQTLTVGQTEDSTFQFLPVGSAPIEEPVAVPKVGIVVGTDTDWYIAADFSNSDSTSKHAVFREDPDLGWGVMFGDGSVGKLAPSGESVKVTLRTGSVEPGDLDPMANIRSIGGLGKLDTWSIFRGTNDYQPPEASDRASALRFRASVLPQLALRAESAITRDEIIAAMTGGAPYRATFTTSDGRTPFSRALFSLEGAGSRQYRVVVVGPESSADGAVQTTDLTEAATWLNGEQIGVEIIGGHGPNNTEAIVDAFVPRALLPTVTVTITNPAGVKDQVNQVIKQFFKPHARDADENFRWEFGGRVPIAVLFALLWESLPGRIFIEISVTDGVTTYDAGDAVELASFELPVLDSTYDPIVNIIVQEP
jgi:hypothetical protein